MKKPKKTEAFEAIKPPQEHGGACPTCGHCKCCEKKAAPVITFPPICTRRHYDDWTYRPTPVWYGTSTATNPILGISTTTNGTGAQS